MTHAPTFAEYIVIVGGFTAIILGSVGFFIHYLRSGLDSSSANIIDPPPTKKN